MTTINRSNTISHAKLTIQTILLAKLKPHPRNPRTHPEPGSPEWDSLKASLESVYFDPLVVNKRNGMLVSGHLRRKVLAEMGVKKADVVVVNVSEDEHIKIMLRANRNTGDWDTTALADLLKDMDDGARLLAGFTAGDMEGVLNEFEVSGIDSPDLASGDRAPFRQCTFTLHDSQFTVVEEAITAAKKNGGALSKVNENSNGNALAHVCEMFNGSHNG